MRPTSRSKTSPCRLIESLEPRTLLSAAIVLPVPNATLSQDTPQSIDLASFFDDPSIPGTLAQITTSLGAITLQLEDKATPQTVANFLNYSKFGLYNSTIIHRVVNDAPPQEFRILQGGGFGPDGQAISTPFGSVPNEPVLSNTRGTIAMAKRANDPNSATSQWFINDSNNTFLDASNGGFTVFGHVVGGMNVVDQITRLSTADGTALNPQFGSQLPVVNPVAAGNIPQPSDLVLVSSVSVLPKITLKVLSSNPGVVSATLSGTQLTLTPAAGASGFAYVTVMATDLSGASVFDNFRVQVNPSAARALDLQLGGGHRRAVSFQDGDGTFATVRLSGPGSAVVHFAGDALRLTGGAHLAGAHISVMGIDAAGTTAASTLYIRAVHGKDNLLVMGGIATDGAFGSVRMIRAQINGDVSIPGGVGDFRVDYARGGTMNLGGPVTPNRRLNLVLLNWLDESLSTTAPISQIRSAGWSNTDDVSESVKAPEVDSLVSFGNFTPGLQLTGVPGRRALGSHVLFNGTIGGVWSIPGGMRTLTVGAVARDFNGTFPTPMRSIFVRGSFFGSLTAPSVATLTVQGAMTGAALKFTAAGRDLGSLSVRRGISSSVIEAAGSIGSIDARFLLNSHVYAGVSAAPGANGLPATAADVTAANFTAPASIGSITLSSSGPLFINSNIAASSVGSLNLGLTATANNGTPFGIATSNLGRLAVSDKSRKQTIVLAHVHDAGTLAAQVAARHLVLGDLAVNIV